MRETSSKSRSKGGEGAMKEEEEGMSPPLTGMVGF